MQIYMPMHNAMFWSEKNYTVYRYECFQTPKLGEYAFQTLI